MIEFDEFVNERVTIEAERLDRKLQHRGKESGAGHIRLPCEPVFETGRDTARLRHPSDPRGMIHHPLALCNSELA